MHGAKVKIVEYILGLGFLVIRVMNVMPKNFLISSTVMRTQVLCREYPAKGYSATLLA